MAVGNVELMHACTNVYPNIRALKQQELNKIKKKAIRVSMERSNHGITEK